MRPLAVVDVETTGLNPYHSDRIVEIAVVLLNSQPGVQLEYTTVVNPERDVGPTSIHGLTASDVATAPRFNQIAGRVADMLSHAVAIVGHCVAFDISFLRAEFGRMGITMPEYPRLDTRSLAGGGTLATSCVDFGVQFDGQAHTALGDAQAAARLFQRLAAANPVEFKRLNTLTPVEWPIRPNTWADPMPRATRSAFSPSLSPRLQNALAGRRLGPVIPEGTAGEKEYSALLDHVLEDRRIEPAEADSLRRLAVALGLSPQRVEAVHLAYLSRLAKAVWADQHLTDPEVRELHAVSRLLGFGTPSERQFLSLAETLEIAVTRDADQSSDSLRGKSVCFTGECLCTLGGVPISRERAEALARSRGLEVHNSVTKALKLLVVGDPNTVSTKAKKARKYGIREIHEPVFWRTIGVHVD